MTKKEFIELAMLYGSTKKEAKVIADSLKDINKELKEDGYDEPYTYNDLFMDGFYIKRIDDEAEAWLYEQGYYD